MIGYDISVNGEKIFAAVDQGVLSAIVTSVNKGSGNELFFDVSGINSISRERIAWPSRELKEGDQITIRITDVNDVSAPLKVKIIDEQDDGKNMLESYYVMKENLERRGLL